MIEIKIKYYYKILKNEFQLNDFQFGPDLLNDIRVEQITDASAKVYVGATDYQGQICAESYKTEITDEKGFVKASDVAHQFRARPLVIKNMSACHKYAVAASQFFQNKPGIPARKTFNTLPGKAMKEVARGNCSVACGDGKRSITLMECENSCPLGPEKKSCDQNSINIKEIDCFEKPCKVEKTSSNFTVSVKEVAKENCSVACGDGKRSITLMECYTTSIHGTEREACDANSIVIKEIDCFNKPCKSTFAEWSSWSDCSMTCLRTLNERSLRQRTRKCLVPDENECAEGNVESQTCTDVSLCSLDGGKYNYLNCETNVL